MRELNPGPFCSPCQEALVPIRDLAPRAGLSGKQVANHIGSGKIICVLEGWVQKHEATRWLTLVHMDGDFYAISDGLGGWWLSPALAASYIPSNGRTPGAVKKELGRAGEREQLEVRHIGNAHEVLDRSLAGYRRDHYRLDLPLQEIYHSPQPGSTYGQVGGRSPQIGVPQEFLH